MEPYVKESVKGKCREGFRGGCRNRFEAITKLNSFRSGICGAFGPRPLPFGRGPKAPLPSLPAGGVGG
jgi:hypothetical protein